MEIFPAGDRALAVEFGKSISDINRTCYRLERGADDV